MSTVKVVTQNVIYQLIGKIVTMSVIIVTTGLITRSFGKEGFGAFNLMINFPAIFYVIADFGFNAIATRELSLSEDKMNKYLGNIALMRILFSITLIVFASLMLLFLPYTDFVKVGVMISLLTILTMSLYATSNIGFQVRLRYDLSNIANSLGSIVFLLIVILVLYFKRNILFAIFGYVVNGLLTVLFSFYFLRKLNIKPIFAFDSKLLKNLLITSAPLGLMFVFSQINFKADSILLSFLSLPKYLNLNNIESVGVYGLSYKVFEVSLILPTFLMNSLYPVMVRHYSIDKKKLLNTFKKSMAILFGLGISCGVAGLFLSDFIIEVLGGSSFYQSVLVLKILLGFVFIFYLTQPLAWLIVTLGGQKYLPYIYLIAAIINVGLNILFIPVYSIYASAHITWISELVILILLGATARLLWMRA